MILLYHFKGSVDLNFSSVIVNVREILHQDFQLLVSNTAICHLKVALYSEQLVMK